MELQRSDARLRNPRLSPSRLRRPFFIELNTKRCAQPLTLRHMGDKTIESASKDRGHYRRRDRNRETDSTGSTCQRILRCGRRAPVRAATRHQARSWDFWFTPVACSNRHKRPSIGSNTVRENKRCLRQNRSTVQQCGVRSATNTPRRLDARTVDVGREREPNWGISMYTRSFPPYENSDSKRRSYHQ